MHNDITPHPLGTAPSRWPAAMLVYVIGYISYGATLVFYAALFPRLARNTPHARALRVEYEHGRISMEELEKEEALERSRISNISTVSSILIFETLVLHVPSCD